MACMHLLLTGNNVVPITMWHGEAMHSTECSLMDLWAYRPDVLTVTSAVVKTSCTKTKTKGKTSRAKTKQALSRPKPIPRPANET